MRKVFRQLMKMEIDREFWVRLHRIAIIHLLNKENVWRAGRIKKGNCGWWEKQFPNSFQFLLLCDGVIFKNTKNFVSRRISTFPFFVKILEFLKLQSNWSQVTSEMERNLSPNAFLISSLTEISHRWRFYRSFYRLCCNGWKKRINFVGFLVLHQADIRDLPRKL